MLFFQLGCDFGDIFEALNISVGLKTSMDPFERMIHDSHCSSLVKLTDQGELFSSHVTWTTYSNMLRSYKLYSFPFNAPQTNAVQHMFSSLPGFLVSGDDFYVLDTELVVMETTNSVMVRIKVKKPKNVPSKQRFPCLLEIT